MPGSHNKPPYKIVGALTRFDERENVHARYELVPDTQEWSDFYRNHPKWERIDLKTKSLPGMMKVGHPWDLPILANERMIIRMLCGDEVVDGIPSSDKQEIDPGRATEKIKGFVRHLGA